MKDIKLKVWDKRTKRMRAVDAFEMNPDGSIGTIFLVPLCNVDKIIRDPSEVDILVYTGFQDKDGKEICEGDILVNIIESDNPWVVEYDNDGGGWIVNLSPECGCYTQLYDIALSFVMVIGNIYENPELLEEENEEVCSRGIE